MSDDYNVLIVGGGPAGLAAAEATAKQGMRTLVLERQNEIGYPIHTSGGCWVKDMKSLGIPEHLYPPVTKVIFLSPHREVPLHHQLPFSIDFHVLYTRQHHHRRTTAPGATTLHCSANPH